MKMIKSCTTVGEDCERLENLQKWLDGERILPLSIEDLKGCLWVGSRRRSHFAQVF